MIELIRGEVGEIKVDNIFMCFGQAQAENRAGGNEDVNREVRRFFLGKSDWDSSKIENDTASPAGVIAFERLVNFCIGKLFPRTGRWIGYHNKGEDKENIADGEQMIKIFRHRINRSNFYDEIKMALAEGLLTGRAFANVYYDGGLTFANIKNDGLIISDNFIESQRASFIRIAMKKADICAIYNETNNTLLDRVQMKTGNLSGLETDTVLCATVPINERFFSEPAVTKYSEGGFRWIQLHFREATRELLTPKSKELKANRLLTFPVVQFKTPGQFSLCQTALPSIVGLEIFERYFMVGMGKRAHPNISIDSQVFRDGTYDLEKGGLIVSNSNTRETKAVELSGDMRGAMEAIQYKDSQIEKIFLTEMMKQVEIPNFQSFEHHTNRLNLLNVLHPMLGSLIDKMSYDLIRKSFELLLLYDEEFQTVARDTKGTIYPVGLLGAMEESEAYVDAARFLQTTSPIVQLQPQSGQNIDGDKMIQDLAAYSGRSGWVKSPMEIKKQREQEAKMMNQKMQTEQQAAQTQDQQQEAAANLNQAKAAEIDHRAI